MSLKTKREDGIQLINLWLWGQTSGPTPKVHVHVDLVPGEPSARGTSTVFPVGVLT